MVERICKECGKIIEPKVYVTPITQRELIKVYASRKYCGDDCQVRALNKSRVGHIKKQKSSIWVSKGMKEHIDKEKAAMNYYRQEGNPRIVDDDVIRKLFETLRERTKLKDWLVKNHPNIYQSFQEGPKKIQKVK